MTRKTILAAALALSAFIPLVGAAAQGATQPALAMPAGQRLPTTAALGDRVVRNVFVNQGGGSIDIVFDMPAGATSSRRVLRLENVGGMLEVVYDTAMPAGRPQAGGAIPTLTYNGGGNYDITYGK